MGIDPQRYILRNRKRHEQCEHFKPLTASHPQNDIARELAVTVGKRNRIDLVQRQITFARRLKNITKRGLTIGHQRKFKEAGIASAELFSRRQADTALQERISRGNAAVGRDHMAG